MTTHKSPADMNRDELRTEAKRLDIPGRGRMSAAELREAVTSAVKAEPAITEEKAARKAKPAKKAAAPAKPEVKLPARLRPRKPSRHVGPMDNAKRRDVYTKQRNGGTLTARQERRLRKGTHA